MCTAHPLDRYAWACSTVRRSQEIEQIPVSWTTHKERRFKLNRSDKYPVVFQKSRRPEFRTLRSLPTQETHVLEAAAATAHTLMSHETARTHGSIAARVSALCSAARLPIPILRRPGFRTRFCAGIIQR